MKENLAVQSSNDKMGMLYRSVTLFCTILKLFPVPQAYPHDGFSENITSARTFVFAFQNNHVDW
jgi:hypothetical protein